MKDTWKRFRTMVAVRSQESFTAVPSPPDKKEWSVFVSDHSFVFQFADFQF